MHAAHHRITGTQGAFSYQDSGYGPSARIDFGFHHMTGGQFVGIGFEFQYFGLKRYHFHQFVNPLGLFGRDVHINGITSPIFRCKADFGKLPLNFFGFCILFVDFVYGDDNGDSGRSGVINGLCCLGHNPVIGCNHQNHDIGNLGASSSHCRKGFVAGGVYKGDLAFVGADMISANMLGNPSGFRFRNSRFTNNVE